MLKYNNYTNQSFWGKRVCTNQDFWLNSPSPTLVFFPVMVSHNIYRKQVHKINKLFLLITLNRHITLEGKKYLKHNVEGISKGYPNWRPWREHPYANQRPPTRRPQSHTQLSTPVASSAERASCELTGARALATVEHGNRLVRIERPRAQGRRPPPDASTGTRGI